MSSVTNSLRNGKQQGTDTFRTLWLWAGLTLAGVALIQSIIQRHARLS
jgi:hypothetical protein